MTPCNGVQPGLPRGAYTEGPEAKVEFLITFQQDEDGTFVAECPAIPGCVSQGRTREEAAVNVRDAIRQCLAARCELGLPLTLETALVDIPA